LMKQVYCDYSTDYRF